MTLEEGAAARPLEEPRWTLVAVLLLICAACLAYTALQFHDPLLTGTEPFFTDFTTFHLVGSLAWSGDLPEAYSVDLLLERQRAVNEGHRPMPWSYPPPFDLAVAALALLPLPLSYLLFVGGTLAAYLLILRRLAGHGFPMLALMMMPVLLVNIRAGQNGLLTGTLIGLFCLLALRRAPRAGGPLGLMVIKPHLALGLGVLLLLTRRWGWLAQALAVAAVAALLSTLAFGTGLWGAFLRSAAETSALLEDGAFRLYRMTSVYASARSFGAPAPLAFGLQAAVALCGLAAIGLAVAERWPARRLLGLTVMATLMVSPYSYDYDLTILGLGLALVFDDLVAPRGEGTRVGLLALLWVLGGYGILATAIQEDRPDATAYAWDQIPYALGGPAYVLLFAATVLALRRTPGREAEVQAVATS